MTLPNTKESIKNTKLPVPSNDNQQERYLSLDLESKSMEAEALVEDLCFLFRNLNLFKSKIRVNVITATESIVADLFATAEKDRTAYGYRKMSTKSFSNSHVGHAAFKRAVGALEAAGMIEVILGRQYGSDGPGERHTASRFRATAALHETALGYGVTAAAWAVHFKRRPRLARIANPVLLRSSSTMFKGRKVPGKSVPFIRTPKIVAMEEQVNDINAFLATRDLYLGDYSHRHFHRIFGMGDYPGHDFKKGGRLYSPGKDSYQQASSKVRETFLFNGEATVEVDIGSSFLTIFRVMTGVEFDRDHDPYDIPGLRRFASKSWTVMTFGHCKFHTRWPADVKRKYKNNFDEGKEGDWGTGNLQKDHPYGLTHKLMLKALPELADWPDSDITWADLQYAESCAVIEAVYALATKYKVVALPVHDSIRVPASKQQLAARVLSEAFRKHVGVAPVLKMK